MNGKIIELARRANVLRTEYAAPKYGIHSEPGLVDIMLFAELIIKECADKLDYESRVVNVTAPQVTCGHILRKHFGLKNDY
jgi:hypothetical protein